MFMKNSAPRLPIALRLTFVLVLSQALLYAAFSFLIMRGNKSAIDAGENEFFRLISNTIDWSIQEELASLDLALSISSADPVLTALLSSSDRAGTLSYMVNIRESLAGRIPVQRFYDTDGKLFLDMQKPELSGAQVPAGAAMLSTLISSLSAQQGIEQEETALYLKVMRPVYHDGQFAGVMEYAREFGNEFMQKLQQKNEGAYFLLLFEDRFSANIIAGTRATTVCPLYESSYDQLIHGQAVWSLECEEARGVGLYPFHDHQGKVSGFIKVELDTVPLSDTLSDIYYQNILLGVVMALILGVSLFFGLQFFLQPLRNLVRYTRNIAEHIIAGDVSYQGDGSRTPRDFKDITSSINDIIVSLRERGALVQAIVEGIPGMVYYVDRNMNVLWANGTARTLLPTLETMNLRDADSGFFLQEKELLNKAFHEGCIATLESCYLKLDGEQECWEHVAVPVESHAGGIDHIIRISRNISDKKAVEAALRQLNEELEHRVQKEIEKRKEGEKMASQQARLAAIGELATGMAHEITQPLNAIAFSVENIRIRYASGTLDKSYLDKKGQSIDSDINRVRRVIEHVRLFVRGAPDDYRIRFSIRRCVDNAMALISVQLATHEIDTEVLMPARLPELYGNPFQYEQVILNLLSNARDAVEERLLHDKETGIDDSLPGKILIRAGQNREAVELVIEDNGIGISAENADRVFDPFFTTKTQGKGTGLGLSISYGIIREMGGTIEFSAADSGTIATVSVPAALAPKEDTTHD